MAKYSKGINLVAGGEKHRVYVKKSPTGVGKGVKGHVMVNHPTEDKGKWDTIDLTEKAGAKTVQDGKNATKKWHKENPMKMQEGNKDLKSLKKKYLGDIYETEKTKESIDLPGFDYWKEKFMKDHNLSQNESINLINDIKNEQRLRGVVDKIYKSKNPYTAAYENSYSNQNYDLPYNRHVDMKTLKARKPDQLTLGEDVFISGSKSVKQYRGDENLPEAKNGMKNCGCKHPKAKYKYGTGALTIPEGSAIVTANGGKNKQALMAYKQGNYKLLNKIIEDMPEDRVSKKQAGTVSTTANTQPVSAGQWTDTYAKLEGMLKHEKNKNLRQELFKRYKAANPSANITEDQYIDNLLTAQKQNYAMQEKYGQDALNQEDWDWIRGTGPRGTSAFKNKRYKDAMSELGMSPLNEEQIGQFQQAYRDLEDAMHDPQFEQNFGKYFKTNPIGKSDQVYRGKAISGKDAIWGNTTNRQFLQLSGYEDPVIPDNPRTPNPPGKTPPEEEWEEVQGTKFKVPPASMSLGETTAIGSVLGKGIQRPRESYLKLDRYNYASQLPKTLREIQLAEQGGRETARDMVAGDTGRYLAQSGNLSAARMKAANDAVVQDTLARQDILNKNVDLSNTELSTNRSLKDYYDDIKRQGINDYNALLVKGGQSIDESFDNYQKMRNENIVATQGLQLMADMNPNYTLVQDADGTVRAVSRYKRKSPGSTPTSTPISTSTSAPTTSVKDNSINMFAPFNKMAQAGLLPPQNKPNLNTSFQQMMKKPPQSGGTPSLQGRNSRLPKFGLQLPTIKEKGTKKAKTYKRK